MPIQSSEIWLMEFLIMGNYAHLPSVLVGKSILESLPNPEFNQLHSELNRIVSILKAIVNQTFDPGEYIADSYVDELGGREDFVEYLRIQLKNWQEISFSSGEYLSSKDLSRLYLNGHLIQKELKSKYFFIRLDLLEGFQVRRFELISDGKENDS